MTVVYKTQVTRPSLGDLFVYELLYGVPNIFSYQSEKPQQYWQKIRVEKQGCLDAVYEESISWTEFFDRKNELRPDIKDLIESYSLSDMIGFGPCINLFSLTHTQLLMFDTLENAKFAYDTTLFGDEQLIMKVKTALETTNNTCVHTMLVNDVKVEDWVPKI